MGEHYEVKCIVVNIDNSGTIQRTKAHEQTCLVDVSEFRKFIRKEHSIVWL